MALGPQTFIDKLLVEKYAEKQVDNHEEGSLVSSVSPDEMMSMMNAHAYNFKNMMAVNNRLTMVCYGIVSKSAKYVQTEAA